MSLSKSLDETSNAELIRILKIRKKIQDEGKCDYCGRSKDSLPTCRFEDRHRGKDPIENI